VIPWTTHDAGRFFISYTAVDVAWAEWIGWVLEEEGLSVKIQAWDFASGSNFILEMHRAATEARRTIAVISADYLKSEYGAVEWAAAFSTDPAGLKRRHVPVRVGQCSIQGLLKAVVYIDLVETDAVEAQHRLLQGVSGQRGKPREKPDFSGIRTQSSAKKRPNFPGHSRGDSDRRAATSTRYMPAMRRTPTDFERRRFTQQAFDTIVHYFEDCLSELATLHQRVEYDLTKIGPTKFRAEIFVDGKSQQRCKVWQGTTLGENGIAYSEHDWGGDNSYNELLTSAPDGLALVATMSMAAGREAEGLNMKQLTPEDAAEYLWRRFTLRLG
jgi:hypothetical protein